MTGPLEPRDPPWLTGPWIVGMGAVGTTLGLLGGSGVGWAVPLFVAYVLIAVVLLSLFVVKRRRSQRS